MNSSYERYGDANLIMKNLLKFIHLYIVAMIILILFVVNMIIDCCKIQKQMEYIEVQIEELEEKLNDKEEVMVCEINRITDRVDKLLSDSKDIQRKVEKLEAILIDEIKEQDKMNWFIQYKESFKEHDYGDPENVYDIFPEEDIVYLQRMVETECHGADFDSKVHVACVALSRVENEKFPNTLKEVITQPNQFSYSRTAIDEETILACEYAFMIGSEADGCLWFHSNSKADTFSGGKYVFTDNVGHNFYK